MRTFALLRVIVAGMAAMALSVAAVERTAAQDEPEPSADAEVIRELVDAQRERVLDEIAAIMAGDRDEAEPRVIEEAEPEDGEAEDGEPEDGEPEDGEPEDGEPEDGEPEDGEPEGDEAGGEGGACEPEASEPEASEPEASEPAGEADAGAAADAEAAAEGEEPESEAAGGQPEGAEPEASGETTVCDLPATGIGATPGSPGGVPIVVAFVALTAAGLGLRRRLSGV
jgi:hypothetical protein